MAISLPPNNNTGLYNNRPGLVPVANNVSLTGNITVDGYISAGGNVYGNALLISNIASVEGNVTGGNFVTAGTVDANTVVANNLTAGNVVVSNIVIGNITANNIFSNVISASGNIDGAYLNANIYYATGYNATRIANGISEANIGTANGNANISINGASNVVVVSQTGLYVDGVVSSTGNIDGDYLNANIYYATGYSANKIYNGTSDVDVPTPNGNANITINGVSNVVVVAQDGLYVDGVVSSTGNINGDYLNANIFYATGYSANKIFNGTSEVDIGSANGNANISINGVSNVVVVSSNSVVIGGTVSATGNISTPGNISGNYIFGSGQYMTLSTYGGVLNPSSISAAGTITGNLLQTAGAGGNIIGVNYAVANYFSGDGSLLTNVAIGNATIIANGNSSVSVAGNSNVTIAVNGATAAIFHTAGLTVTGAISASGAISAAGNIRTSGNVYVTGANTTVQTLNAATVNSVTISATGNVTGNYFIGNGSQLTGVVAVSSYSNANVANYLPTFSGNLAGGNLILTAGTGNAYVHDLIATGSALVTGVVSAAGNVRGGNINTAGIVTATGNVIGNYFIGNGSQLTGITTSTYSNSNVSSFLAAFGSNVVSTTGNVTASYLIGNGSLLTNLTGANVSGTVANATFATSAGTATSATTAATVTTNAQPNITSVGTLTSVTVTGNATAGNILTGGFVSATGNVTGNYFIGNGSQLTGLPAGYSDANVATFLAAFGSNTVSTTGTITSGNLTAGNILTTGTISATANVVFAANANVEGGRLQSSNASGFIFTQAAMTAINLGTGANIVNVSAFTGNAVNSITMGSGALTGNITLRGNVTVQGNASTGTGNLTITSGNISIGGVGGAAYLKTTANTFYLLNTANQVILGNISANVGNVTTGANISAVGNISTNSFMTVKSYTAAALTAITGSPGQLAAVSDSAIYTGKLAYWANGTSWRYVADDSAV